MQDHTAVLFEPAMLPEIVAMIGHVDDERAAVEILDGGVIRRDDAALIGRREAAKDERDLRRIFGTHLWNPKVIG